MTTDFLSQRKHVAHDGEAQLSKELAGMAEARRVARIRAHQNALERDRLSQLTREERTLRRQAREQLATTIASREVRERLRSQRAHQAEQIRAANSRIAIPVGKLHDGSRILTGDSTTGELWWAETDVHWNDPQLVAFFESDGLHVGGEVVVSEESDLHHGFVEAVSIFGLGSDRMPDGDRFISSPAVLLDGVLDGAVIPDNGWLDWGDEWSKCWLNTSQTILTPAFLGGLPAFLVLGSSSQTLQLIDIATTGKIEFQRATLPGFLSVPAVEFPMYDFARSNGIVVELVVNFTYQLEGDHSAIDFHTAQERNNILMQTFQWSLQRI